MSTVADTLPSAEITADAATLYELERGKPMPSRNHAIAQTNLCVELSKNRSYRPMSELYLRLQGAKHIPDISVFQRSPADFFRDEIEVTTPPVTAVEIYSPMQGYNAVMEKVAAYLAAGVKSCWVVDPYERTVTIIHGENQARTFIHGQTATDPVTGLTADLNEVFS